MYSAGKRRYREGMQWALVCWFLGGVRRSDGGVGHCMSASHGQMNEIQIRSGQVTGSPKRNAASIIIQIRSRPLLSFFFFSGPAQNTHTLLCLSHKLLKNAVDREWNGRGCPFILPCPAAVHGCPCQVRSSCLDKWRRGPFFWDRSILYSNTEYTEWTGVPFDMA